MVRLDGRHGHGLGLLAQPSVRQVYFLNSEIMILKCSFCLSILLARHLVMRGDMAATSCKIHKAVGLARHEGHVLDGQAAFSRYHAESSSSQPLLFLQP